MLNQIKSLNVISTLKYNEAMNFSTKATYTDLPAINRLQLPMQYNSAVILTDGKSSLRKCTRSKHAISYLENQLRHGAGGKFVFT